ncbi:MAG: bifunctional salicylyl-CoA 5-hydroxylase/oxidoreductase [Pseudomonadota bacterium]
MKITVIGGGPGGMYFALLTKKRCPHFEIEVVEQNRFDDTFGFGVVFSDETLDEFLSADPESYDLIRDSFAYWTDMVVERNGKRIVIGGNGFAGCSRMTLLLLLQQRCRDVGVKLTFETRIDADQLENQFPDSDIIVDAGGVNSPIRQRFADAFGANIGETRNKFTWLGAETPLDAFTFFFRETPQGLICAHTYQYEKGRSTWVVETTPECWEASGFGELDDVQSADRLSDIFAEELKGHRFITNRSVWRNFPTITCESWSHKNIVLLGDCKATAHWSIGSGTKLAMECAIALSDAVINHEGDAAAAFAEYEKVRRTPVEIIQHNAQVSLRWFENMPLHWHKSDTAFAFSCMSRSKSVDWDNLLLRDPAFLAQAETDFYERYEKTTGRSLGGERPTPMFTPFSLRDMTVNNRVVVAPMAQYSAVDGMPGQWHFSHYTTRALGGAGLVFTEMTCTAPEGRITDACTGIWSEAQAEQWRRIVAFVHDRSESRICMQLGHAGRKGSTLTPEDGMDMPRPDNNWPLISASAIPYIDGTSQVPKAMTREDMDRVRDEFVAAASLAESAGFDMLELHCAHGYLLASFLSPLTNQRSDDYGGSAENAVRFPLEVFRAVRDVWPDHKPMSVRLSASDWAPDGVTLDDIVAYGKAFKAAGADILHISSGETVRWQKPIWGRMWQTPFAEHVKHHVEIPTIAVGDITTGAQINTIIADERADLCALARPHLNNPYFTRMAAGHYGVRGLSWPLQYDSGCYQLFSSAAKENAKALDLASKARPNRRHYQQAAT